MVADRFRLRYKLTPELYMSYFKLVRMRAKGEKTWARFLRPFLGGMLVGLMVVGLYAMELVSHREIIAWFLGAALTLIAVAVCAAMLNKKMVGRMIGSHDAMTGQFTLAAYDGGGVQISGKHSTASYDWKAFMDVSEAPDTMILWIDRGAGVIVPNKAFSSDEERLQFAEFVNERIAAHKTTDELPASG